MARASVSKTRAKVYERLGVSDGYGTLKTTARYPSDFIDNQIISADIEIAKFLITNKQDSLLNDIVSLTTIQHGDGLPQNWAIVKVEWDTTGDGVFERAKEIDWGIFREVSQGGVFDISNYKGYFVIRDNSLYAIPVATDFRITYIDLPHPATLSTLKCPDGFEDVIADRASAKLLMKRGDKPDRSEFYNQEADRFLQVYKLPEMNRQDKVEQ